MLLCSYMFRPTFSIKEEHWGIQQPPDLKPDSVRNHLHNFPVMYFHEKALPQSWKLLHPKLNSMEEIHVL